MSEITTLLEAILQSHRNTKSTPSDEPQYNGRKPQNVTFAASDDTFKMSYDDAPELSEVLTEDDIIIKILVRAKLTEDNRDECSLQDLTFKLVNGACDKSMMLGLTHSFVKRARALFEEHSSEGSTANDAGDKSDGV
jgi:hypothetical protein